MTTVERIHASGILRLGTPKRGFRYQNVDGHNVSAPDLARIRQLRIPPAWTNVAINLAETGRVQAVGQDAAGRWQYLYHESHVRKREHKKFLRAIKFAESLPAIRKAVNQDLRKSGLEKDRVLAGLVRILSMSFLRPGSEVYANENGSYGVTTLRPRHVGVKRNRITFDFPGKSGVVQHSEFEDRLVARLMRQLLKQTNRRVFKYEDDDKKLIDVKAKHINDYIRGAMGKFSAKDFRTWSGTLVCACALARKADANEKNPRVLKRRIVIAIKETARALGNTPAVCRSAYICPAILTSFEKGKTISHCFASVDQLIAYRGATLHKAEKALLGLLKQEIT